MTQTTATTSARPRRRVQAVALTAATVTMAATAIGVTGAWAMSAAGAVPTTGAAEGWAVSTAAAVPASGAAAPASTRPGSWPNHHNGNHHNGNHHNGNHHNGNHHNGNHHNGNHGWPGGMHQGSAGTGSQGSQGWPGGMWGGMGGGMGGGPWGGGSGVTSASCTVPTASTSRVTYVAMDMGGSMMGGSMMRLMPMWARVQAGTVTIDLVNRGTMPHELLVYPLAAGQVAGQRTVGTNDRIDETGVLGEVEPVCDQPGDVDGIAVGNVGRVSLQLQPGRYEIVCNLPGHYRVGMYATLVVT